MANYGGPPPSYQPAPQQYAPQPSANYRYDNLALAANSYRFVGTLLKVVGVIIVLCGPLLLIVGMNTEAVAGRCPNSLSWCSSDELAGGVNQTDWGFVWPLAVVLATLWLGVPMVIRGIIQSAHGEALLALADIAVATTSIGNPGLLAAWSGRRSVSSFVGVLVAALVGVVLLVFISIGVAVHIADAKKQASGTSSRPSGLGASAPMGFAPGATIQFIKGSADADWLGVDEPHLDFLSGESAIVDTVAGSTFTTKAFPGQFAPISAARVRNVVPVPRPVLGDAGGRSCSVRLRMVSLSPSSATCSIVTDLMQGGVVSYPCSGGTATASFGQQGFSGKVAAGDQLSLSHTGTFDALGCTWTADQRIDGAVSKDGSLAFTYQASAPADCAFASSACSATGTLAVERQ
jgi:hypothetical protein